MLNLINKETLSDLQDMIIGEILTVEEDNNVKMTYISEYRNDVAVKLILNLIFSNNTFGLEIVDNEEEKDCVRNQDNNPDERFKHRKDDKPKSMYAPEGFDGYVFLNKNCGFQTKEEKLPVSFRAIMFHELAECFAKVEYNLQYKHAHSYAVDLEKKLLEQRPVFTEGRGGECLERIKEK